MKENRKRIPWNTICVSAIAVSFFLAVFVPINAFINNIAEFPLVKFGQLWIVSTGLFVLLSALFSAILAISFRSRKLFPLVLSLMTGFALAMYVQGNLINLDYGVLDGHAIPWDRMVTKGIVNTCVWLAIIIGMAWQTVKRGEDGETFVRIAMVVFLAFQCLVLGIKSISTNISSPEPAQMTERNLMRLSSQRNVLVFMLDTLESSLFEDILKQHPEVKGWLRGFTWHRNTIGLYPTTKGALPQLITGIANDNSVPYPAYKEQAYRNSKILREVANNDFAMDLYVSPVFAPPKSMLAEMSFLDNASADVKGDSMHSALRGFESVVNSAGFTYLPHFLKRYHEHLLIDIAPTECDSGYRRINSSRELEAKLFSSIGEGMIEVDDKPRYKFYALYGTHLPTFTVAKGRECFKQLNSFFGEMRDLGIWSNATVVILADHGIVHSERPTILCRDRDDDGPFEISDEPFSYSDIDSVFCSALRSEPVRFPVSTGARNFHFYLWGGRRTKNEGYLPRFFERKFDSNRNPVDGADARHYYRAEEFPMLAVKSISVEGYYPDIWMWTIGTDVEAFLPVPAELVGKPMQAEILTFALLGERKKDQCVSFTMNGIDIGEEKYGWPGADSKTVLLNIPAAANTNAVLKLSMHIASPVTPDFWGTIVSDPRSFGIRIHGFSLDAPGGSRSFDFYNDTRWRPVEGFADGEPDGSGRWTIGKTAKMEIPVTKELACGDILVQWRLHPFLANGRVERQRLKVKCGGRILFNEVFMDRKSLANNTPVVKNISFVVPAKFIKDGSVNLELSMPDAISPKEAGVSGDTRALAVFLRSCKMEPAR